MHCRPEPYGAPHRHPNLQVFVLQQCRSSGQCRKCLVVLLYTKLVLAAAMFAAPARAAWHAPQGQNRQSVHGSFSLDSEVAGALDGGIERGSAADQLFKASLWVDGGGRDLPAGGRLKASFIAIRSDRPTETRIGDAQGVSNIAAPSRSRLYELWYRQRLPGRSWTLRFGLISADDYFDVTRGAGTLINSSFGTPPSLTANTVPPIYPTAGLGAMATWRRGAWTNRTGLFQADPNDRGTALSRGALAIDEISRAASATDEGTYKLGLWSYRPNDVDPFRAQKPFLRPSTWGAYFSAEHALPCMRARAPIGFLRIGVSPTAASTVPLDVQAGVLIPAPFSRRPDDQLSVGIASARLRGAGTETAYEITYALALSNRLSLQPDLQYVDRLNGSGGSALVAIVRLHIDLD